MERHSTSSDLIAVQKRLAPLYLFLSKNRTDPAFGLILALIFLGILIPQEQYSKLYPKPGRRRICHLGRHCFDYCTTGSLKRSSYVVERTRKRQNKFPNSFYQFQFNLFLFGAGPRLTQRNKRLLAVVSLSGSARETNCSQGISPMKGQQSRNV